VEDNTYFPRVFLTKPRSFVARFFRHTLGKDIPFLHAGVCFKYSTIRAGKCRARNCQTRIPMLFDRSGKKQKFLDRLSCPA